MNHCLCSCLQGVSSLIDQRSEEQSRGAELWNYAGCWEAALIRISRHAVGTLANLMACLALPDSNTQKGRFPLTKDKMTELKSWGQRRSSELTCCVSYLRNFLFLPFLYRFFPAEVVSALKMSSHVPSPVVAKRFDIPGILVGE